MTWCESTAVPLALLALSRQSLCHGTTLQIDMPGTALCSAQAIHVLGLKGKSGAVPRNVWVYFLFWGCARLLSPLQKQATKRVCMVESQGYLIWGAPDFCLPPSTNKMIFQEEKTKKLSTSLIHIEYPPFPILLSSQCAEEHKYLLPQQQKPAYNN